jgi:hypothetical protein
MNALRLRYVLYDEGNIMSTRRTITSVLLVMIILACASCKDDNPTKPDNSIEPTMANIWPNADGSAWLYASTYSDRLAPKTGTTPSPHDTEIPSMSELYELLQSPLPGVPTLGATGTYEIALDGIVTTNSGVEAQRVVSTHILVPGFPASQKRINTTGSGDNFLRAVARSRPDLRSKIPASKGWTEKRSLDIAPPTFIGGYAFAFEDSGYFGYGDLDQGHSFVYLSGDLEVGTEFTLQLLPLISTDIWLTAKIWSQGSLKVGDTTYRNVIECMYVIDFGESIATDENNEVIFVKHDYFYGVTHFAPEVGPIRGRERQFIRDSNAVQGLGPQRIVEYYEELSSASLNK